MLGCHSLYFVDPRSLYCFVLLFGNHVASVHSTPSSTSTSSKHRDASRRGWCQIASVRGNPKVFVEKAASANEAMAQYSVMNAQKSC